ncbi:MAG TPA: RsmD family RNA methyltransferase [Propioniciclava tarda]|nr:RsmD family RNA methyltransferase [Propioniciclava tarda]HQA31314.1 RsmD family RNA methyltransferase [Propioniciclava tarda]HQD61058.1 RsmD family RNA methyltransferase [Propioniciclava tarda]
MSRIVAGRRGGQRLVMPPHDRTRPTSDRVRESAFNLIAAWAGTAGEPADTQLDRFSFLDLFAGSGAVALEAASRGAGPVVAVEKDAPTASVARRNVSTLGLAVDVVVSSVDAYLAERARRPFDIVWLDPPYALDSDAVARVGARIVEGGWLAGDGLIVTERSARDVAPPWPTVLRNTWSRRYGETTLYFATQEVE